MPPKSKKKLRGKAKQKMLITSRLMAISLHVDDYIYKNKPISLLEANKYDEEITFLKLKCKQDTRSLQVVEKLKIFMKSIIKEQSTDRLQDNSSGFTDTCVSNNPLVANFVSEDVDNISNKIQNTTRELYNNSEKQNSKIPQTKQDNNKLKNISIDITNLVIDGNNSEVKQDESNDLMTPNNATLKLNDKSEETIRFISLDKYELLANAKKSLIPTNLPKQPEIVSITQEKLSPIQKIYNPNITLGITNEKKQTKANKKTVTKNKNAAKGKITIKLKKVISHSDKEFENKSSGVNKTKIKRKEKPQIDLSWVENIKYVREVSTDEHTTDTQVDDSFWANLAVPGSWCLNDFD